MENLSVIMDTVNQIAGIYNNLEKVYLYNRRVGLKDNTTSFKICIIMDTENKAATERNIYLNIDCEIPYDVLIYTPDEWEIFTKDSSSFAYKVHENGVVIYG